VDRQCATFDCPAAASSSTTTAPGGAVIVVPVGPSTGGGTEIRTALITSTGQAEPPGGGCATGWTICPQSVGGNCCMSPFSCGTASCTEVINGVTSVMTKMAATTGAGVRTGQVDWVVVLGAGLAAFGVVIAAL
jgi:progranulin